MSAAARLFGLAAALAALFALAYKAAPEIGEAAALGVALFGALGASVFGFFRRRMTRHESDIAAAERMEATGEACLLVDADGKKIWTGPRWIERVGDGLTIEDALDALALGDGPARDRLGAVAEAAAAGRAGSDEIQRREGEVRIWVSVAATPLPGSARAVLWRVNDAGARGTDALRTAVERLSSLVDGSPFGAVEVDFGGRLVYANRVFGGWIGWSAAEAVGRGIKLAELLKEGDAAAGGVWVLSGRDGRRADVFATVVPSAMDRRRFVLTDRSSESAWEAALARAEGRYRRLVELAPVGIASIDPGGRLIEANVAFCDLIGESEARVVGSPFAERFAQDMRSAVAAWLGSASAGDRRRPLDATLLGRTERPVQLWSGGASDGGAEPRVVYVIDLTDRRNLEHQFAHAQKMQAIGQMAGGIAHDFNNLLTAMIGHCDLLLLRHHAGDPSFADILQIKQNANRAASLVRQLLAFSRRQTLRPRVVDIGDVMSELANLLRRLIGQTIRLDLSAERDLGLVRVDTGQLEQVVVNLAVNARDAMPKGGRLAIRLARHKAERDEQLSHETMPAGDYLRIEIEDSGEGILPEHIDKVFEPFFTTKAVGAGTGLGLSTVYGIVKQTGGFVSVASKRGEGTIFSLYLPRIDPDSEAAQEATEARAAPSSGDLTGSASVLLVEDEFAVRSFAARALRNKGYKVIEAEDGEAALASVERTDEPIDLMITDVLMPNIDGPTLIRRARALRPNLKVIVISGYAEDAFRQELGSDLDLGFLPKPFSLKDLAAKVKDALGE